MEIIGYILAILIGITLGLIGGGGSILAVPVLAYCYNLEEKVATAYSLFVVGIAALIGGIRQHKNGHVDWRTAIVFGVPAIIGVWIVRYYVVPILPDVLLVFKGFEFTRRMAMFGLFSILMIVAAYTMLKDKRAQYDTHDFHFNLPLIIVEGIVVGGITGFVGAGGGFLIIPALILFANLPIKIAIGTSLMIIALKALLGFFGGDALIIAVNWEFLISFTSLAVIGIFVGIYINQFIDGNKLKTGFGYFLIIMGIIIFATEFIFKIK